MKQKIILTAILLAWVFAAMVLLSSCNLSKHVNKISTDSTSVIKKDSASNSTADLSKSEGSSTTDSSDVGIVFYPEQDTSFKGGNEPLIPSITIQKTDSGIVITNHSGSKIKSISVKDSKTVEQHKDTSYRTTNAVVIHNTDSTHIEKSVKIKEVETKPGLSLFKWIGLIVIIAGCIYIASKIYLYFNPEATGVFALLAGWRRKKENS